MPTVEFQRSTSVPLSPSTAWEVITDVRRVAEWAAVLGDVEELEHLSRYRVVLADRVGPFALAADLDVDVVEARAPSRLRLVADGEDRQVKSRIRIEASVSLEDESPGARVDVQGRYEVTGRVATLGASIIRAKGEKILDEFLAAAREELQ